MKKHRWIKKGFCGLLVGLLLTQTVVIAKTEEPEVAASVNAQTEAEVAASVKDQAEAAT